MIPLHTRLIAFIFFLTLASFFILGTQITTIDDIEAALPTIETTHYQKKHHDSPLPDFSRIHNTQEKKQSFFGYLHPIIQDVNNQVMSERAKLIELKQKPTLTSKDKRYLGKLAKTYRVKLDQDSHSALFTRLLLKVDRLPPSLVLAQAANESAWGTSRFAKTGNNLFGQWCFSKGCGIVPQRRNSNAAHEVAKFDSVYNSVESYVLNINRHAEYKKLREIRQRERNGKKNISGLALADGLIGYSERGQDYVNEIKSMIRFNNLSSLDKNS